MNEMVAKKSFNDPTPSSSPHPFDGGRLMVAATTLPAEQAIAEAAARYRNWGRWGPDDVLGTVNFIDDAKRRQAAGLFVAAYPSRSRSRSTPTDRSTGGGGAPTWSTP